MCLHYSHPICNHRILLLIRLLNRRQARATTSIMQEIRDKEETRQSYLDWLLNVTKKKKLDSEKAPSDYKVW